MILRFGCASRRRGPVKCSDNSDSRQHFVLINGRTLPLLSFCTYHFTQASTGLYLMTQPGHVRGAFDSSGQAGGGGRDSVAPLQESRFATLDNHCSPIGDRGQCHFMRHAGLGPVHSCSGQVCHHSAPNCSSKSRCWKDRHASSRSNNVLSVSCCGDPGSPRCCCCCKTVERLITLTLC